MHKPGTTLKWDRASRSFSKTLASAKGTIAPAYHGNKDEATWTNLWPEINFTIHGPRTDKLRAPVIASTAVPSRTIPMRSDFSALAALWTSFGNITVASGPTSHMSARDKVPALP